MVFMVGPAKDFSDSPATRKKVTFAFAFSASCGHCQRTLTNTYLRVREPGDAGGV